MMTTQILYIVFILIGIVFLGFSLFGGDADLDMDLDIDISDAASSIDSPNVFSLRTIATFILSFGIAGVVSIHNDKGLTVQLISGFISGIVVAGLYFLVMKGMYSMQGDTSVESKTLVGLTGYVTTSSTSNGLLQIKVSANGSSYEYTARSNSNETFRMNEKVKIVSADGGMIIVEKIEN